MHWFLKVLYRHISHIQNVFWAFSDSFVKANRYEYIIIRQFSEFSLHHRILYEGNLWVANGMLFIICVIRNHWQSKIKISKKNPKIRKASILRLNYFQTKVNYRCVKRLMDLLIVHYLRISKTYVNQKIKLTPGFIFSLKRKSKKFI